MPQIDYPPGFVTHTQVAVRGVPGVNLPEWAAPGTKIQTLYPLDMVRQGYIYVREEFATALRVGDPIQIDRHHTTIVYIADPETVVDVGRTPHETCTVRRVGLSRDARWI